MLLQRGYTNSHISIHAVDKSSSQIAAFNRVATPWLSRQWSIDANVVQADVLAFLESNRDRWDLVFVGYLDEDMSDDQKQILDQALSSKSLLTTQGSWIRIARDSRIRQSAVRYSDLPGVHSFDQGAVPSCLALVDLCNEQIEALHQPDEWQELRSDKITSVLADYFMAWENHDTESIRQVFAEDAIYEIAGKQSLLGIHAIEAYWQGISQTQRNVRTAVLCATRVGNTVNCWWKASFLRTDLEQQYFLTGILSICVEDGRISRLTECYVRATAPRIRHE